VSLWYLLSLFFVYIFILNSVAWTSLQSDFVSTFSYWYLSHCKCEDSLNVLQFSCVYFAFDIFLESNKYICLSTCCCTRIQLCALLFKHLNNCTTLCLFLHTTVTVGIFQKWWTQQAVAGYIWSGSDCFRYIILFHKTLQHGKGMVNHNNSICIYIGLTDLIT